MQYVLPYSYTIYVCLGDKLGDTRRKGRLTARRIDTLTEAGRYHDGGGTGLYLRIMPSGSRQWVQRVTIQGKRIELGLGSPPAISLAMARKTALENKGKAMAGENPLAAKRNVRALLTFGEATEKYLQGKLGEFKNEKHQKQWRSTLDRYAAPTLGKKLVSEIELQDVLRVLEPIWHSKTETAKRLRGRLENILSWATVAGHRKGDNPARWRGNLSEILPKPSKIAQTTNQPSLALDDVAGWWSDLTQRDGMASKALQFATLTAARSGEVRGMTWSEIDNTTWSIPAARMKNGKPHRVPLTHEAIELLNSLPRLQDSNVVFHAPKGGILSDMALSSVMRRLHQAKLAKDCKGYIDRTNNRAAVPHGLRSAFRQWAAEQGYPRDMAEMALAHFIGSEVERAYQRSDMLERRREMMAAWAAFCVGQLEHTKKVVSLAEWS